MIEACQAGKDVYVEKPGTHEIYEGRQLIAAAKERVALGISTLQAESILHDGVDWETKHAQAVKEAAARREAGLAVPGAAAAEPAAAVQTPAPHDPPPEGA